MKYLILATLVACSSQEAGPDATPACDTGPCDVYAVCSEDLVVCTCVSSGEVVDCNLVACPVRTYCDGAGICTSDEKGDEVCTVELPQ